MWPGASFFGYPSLCEGVVSLSEVCVWVGVGWSCKWVFMDEWGRHELGVSGTYLTRGRVRPADVQIRAQSFARL